MLCFDGSPVEGDTSAAASRNYSFQITMMEALYKNQPACCCVCLLPPCGAMYTRYTVLDRDMSRYLCCQGYMDNRCFRAGSCGERSCPLLCLCIESWCCLGPSISATRMVVMDQYQLKPDPCDNRIVRLTNCLLMLSCVCDLLSICIREFRHIKDIIHSLANCVAYMTIGCMASQVLNEVHHRKGNYQDAYSALADSDYGEGPGDLYNDRQWQ
mmetsp:Transcript_26806/g.44824  ORF Transcript_26806/g.44824 Transcript_26806/m.44824 type:complete len:213 (+) Transcript_26806:90-728(+)